MLSPPAKVVEHRRCHRRRTSLLHGSECLDVRANLFLCLLEGTGEYFVVRKESWKRDSIGHTGLKVSSVAACAQWSRSP